MKPLLIILGLAFATAASAQLLHGVTDPPVAVGGASPAAPSGCLGVINAGAGCPLPMLGM